MDDLSFWLRGLYLSPSLQRLLVQQCRARPDWPAETLWTWLLEQRSALTPAQRHQLDSACRQDLSPAWKLLEKSGVHFLPWPDAAYPPLLRESPDPPLALWCIGQPGILAKPSIAVVGSRHPTSDGRDCSRHFARELSRTGITVVSGLAYGVDVEAHRGALEAPGHTVAVMGTGPDRIYPSCHRDVARRIAESGALLSEWPPGTEPRKSHFPRRNRIIAGISAGVLVVQAAIQSGSLITARLAAEAGRAVFAIPGSIHQPLAKGCHQLIREGAILTESVQDMIDDLRSLFAWQLDAMPPKDERIASREGIEGRILDAVGHQITSIDDISERLNLPAELVASTLLLLELEGAIQAASGGYRKSLAP